MNYTTHTEDFIKKFYIRISVLRAEQLDFKIISMNLGIHVLLVIVVSGTSFSDYQ